MVDETTTDERIEDTILTSPDDIKNFISVYEDTILTYPDEVKNIAAPEGYAWWQLADSIRFNFDFFGGGAPGRALVCLKCGCLVAAKEIHDTNTPCGTR
jgi:hypothetical protein